MGGDLNLKKSWHPNLLENQRRVWEEERKALLERRRIEELRREVREERILQELQKADEEFSSVQSRVEWLYSSASSNSQISSNTDQLLGRKRGPRLGEKLKVTQCSSTTSKLPTSGLVVRDDPLSIMKKNEISQRRKMLQSSNRIEKPLRKRMEKRTRR